MAIGGEPISRDVVHLYRDKEVEKEAFITAYRLGYRTGKLTGAHSTEEIIKHAEKVYDEWNYRETKKESKKKKVDKSLWC